MYSIQMSLILLRTLNKRNIELHARTRGETVGVLRKDGEYRYVPWLGFVDRQVARDTGRPVRLLISRVGRQEDLSVRWEDVATGKHVQGCLTDRGAYAVIDEDVSII
jgi:hypothetical protein